MNEDNNTVDPTAPLVETTVLPTGMSAHPAPQNLWKLVLGCIGVVYGDIGTSPLYALRESLHAASRDGLQPQEVIGVVSLLLWTLVLIVTLKYVTLIMRADNRGEGGTLSLVALVQQALMRRPVGESRSRRVARSLGKGISGTGRTKRSNFTLGPVPACVAARPCGRWAQERAASAQSRVQARASGCLFAIAIAIAIVIDLDIVSSATRFGRIRTAPRRAP